MTKKKSNKFLSSNAVVFRLSSQLLKIFLFVNWNPTIGKRLIYVDEREMSTIYSGISLRIRIKCVQHVETQIVAPAPSRLWQYISLPRGWPSEDEADGPAAGTLRTGYREETEMKWRHHFNRCHSDVLFKMCKVRALAARYPFQLP